MGGELATSVAPGTSILPVREAEDKKNPQKGHSRCILLIPRTCNTGCEVFSHISIRKMLHEKILAIDMLANYRWFSVGIFLLQDVRLFSQPGVVVVVRAMTALLQPGLWFNSFQTGSLRSFWSSNLLEKLSPSNSDLAVRNHVPSAWGRGEGDTAEDRRSSGEGRKVDPSPAFSLAVACH